MRIPVRGQLQSNEAAVTRRAVLAGAGIAMLPTYFVSADVASGDLIRLLPDCEPEPLGIHARICRASISRSCCERWSTFWQIA